MSEPKSRDLSTPTRDELLARFHHAESQSRVVLGGLCIAAVIMAVALVLRPPDLAPLWIAGVAALGFFGFFHGFHYFLARKKKALAELRADVSFGHHTRDSLIALTARVFRKLDIRPGTVPVFITRDKDINAFAMRVEFLPGLRMFNGVYLNRSIIHLLDEAELESVIGHELGHVLPYSPLLSRCYLIHAVVAALAAIWVGSFFAPFGFILMAPAVAIGLVSFIINIPHRENGIAIEFLCDDFGAKAAGVIPAISSDFKINAESEIRRDLMIPILTAHLAGTTTPLTDLLKIYDDAVPFGRTEPEAVKAELQRLMSVKKSETSGASLRGFFDYLRSTQSTSEHNEALAEEVRILRLSSELPTLLPNRSPWLQGSAAWTDEHLQILMTAVENKPESFLFRVPEEFPAHETTHPGPSRRMLFLWRTYRDAK